MAYKPHPPFALLMSLFLMAVASGVADLHAQSTPPRPAVSVKQQPPFFFSTLAADLNEDGRPDLVGSTGASDLQIAFGAGDGTFGPSRTLNRQGRALGIGDFNGDGHADIVITGLSILPGRGDGTFGSPRLVDSSATPSQDELSPRVVVGDFNGDGKQDIALIDDGRVCIYPGRGDFTFDTRVELTAEGPGALTAADFNGDRRLDLAASTGNGTVDVFINQGGLLFAAQSLPVGFGLMDIASADFNKDGKPDLVVTMTNPTNGGWAAGTFHILLGNGDGTFQASVAHPTGARGSMSIAVGDFNQDGNPDVATGNRSTVNIDTSCTGNVYWDSVTIVPGTGTGAFAAPSTFRLGTRNRLDETYQNTHNMLSSADLNGDGRTDLVASPGVVLLSRAPVANRSPVVSAGPDQTIEPGTDIRFEAIASDADNDWLDFQWRDPSGAVFGPRFDSVPGSPMFCWGAAPGTYTVTATDGQGGTASDSMTVFPQRPDDVFLALERPSMDETLGTATPYTIQWASNNLTGVASFRVLSSADNGKSWTAIPGCSSLPGTATQCTWSAPGPVTDSGRVQVEAYDAGGTRLAFDASDLFRIVSGPSTSLPGGWWQADVGSVGALGSATYDGSTFTVKGAGTDIWGTADEFHWAFTLMSGDFDVVARVKSVENVSQWTKAGLMVREWLNPGSIHASVFVTPTTVKGIAFQRRPTFAGTSVSTAGPSITAPVWLRLSRAGNQVTAFYRTSSTAAWTAIGTETFPALAYNVQVGLAVSSHVHGTLAAAAFDNVAVIPPDTRFPPGWAEEDIGAVGAAGSAEATPSTARVTGSGADIWGTADEFHWAFRPATGDFSFEALVDSVENINRWTKAGLMIRASSSAGSQHASVFATPTTEKGVAFQGRPATNGASIQASGGQVAAAPSVWLRLTRRGTNINAYFRKSKTDPWRNLGVIALPGLPATVEVGFAVSSHVDGTLATARFSQFAIEPMLTWTTAQIGPGASASYVDGTFFSAQNRGADIWGTSDAFTYVYTAWSGDGTLTARLNQLDFVNAWTKGGLMFRESLAPGAAHAFVLASPAKGVALQYRPSTNALSASAGTFAKNAPGEFDPGFWLQINREGDVFTAYISTDTFTWMPVGRAFVPMPATVFIGIAVTSHDANAAAWGLFDDVTVRRDAFQPTPTPPFR